MSWCCGGTGGEESKLRPPGTDFRQVVDGQVPIVQHQAGTGWGIGVLPAVTVEVHAAVLVQGALDVLDCGVRPAKRGQAIFRYQATEKGPEPDCRGECSLSSVFADRHQQQAVWFGGVDARAQVSGLARR